MENTIILDKTEERDVAFRQMISAQKCPFRFKTRENSYGVTSQEMMPCDPDCLALLHKEDKSSFSCLRLMNVRYDVSKDDGITILAGVSNERY